MNQEQYRYKRLNDFKRDGVEVRKTDDIRFNGGSETSPHLVCKALASFVMSQAGWTVNGEVETPRGEIDVLAYGRKGYLSYAVEIESSPPEGIQDKYLDQYIRDTPVDDLIILNCSQMPSDMMKALEWVSSQLPAKI